MWSKITKDEMSWLGVDFDGTLANNSGYPDFLPSEPTDGAVEAMKRLDAMGYKIIIYTSRSWADYKPIEDWCSKYGIPARRIICGKPLFLKMIDDLNIEFSGNWEDVIAKLK